MIEYQKKKKKLKSAHDGARICLFTKHDVRAHTSIVNYFRNADRLNFANYFYSIYIY